GTFKKRPSIRTGHDGIALANGDFDEDGLIDLALVSASSNSLIFYRGDGTGNFHLW
ncbi:MAG TPA: VCBS repeat-containing protein, partial [Deltaproteobacteria bacterium]|nr:VCBS repeat-containing protein [Deltaproteobacteria bacterium]